MPKPIESIRVDILPNVLRVDPELGERIVAMIHQELHNSGNNINDCTLFVYGTTSHGIANLEVTTADRQPVAIIDDSTLLDTLAAAAMERGVPLQQFINQLAKEYKG